MTTGPITASWRRAACCRGNQEHPRGLSPGFGLGPGVALCAAWGGNPSLPALLQELRAAPGAWQRPRGGSPGHTWGLNLLSASCGSSDIFCFIVCAVSKPPARTRGLALPLTPMWGDGKRRCTTALGLTPASLTKVFLGKAEMGRLIPAAEGNARWAAPGAGAGGMRGAAVHWHHHLHQLRGNRLLAGGEAAPRGRAEPWQQRGVSEGLWPPSCPDPGALRARVGWGLGVPRAAPPQRSSPTSRRRLPRAGAGTRVVSFQAGPRAEGPHGPSAARDGSTLDDIIK